MEKSDFVQKFVGATALLMTFWFLLTAANQMISSQSLADTGYYDSMVSRRNETIVDGNQGSCGV